MVDMDPKIISLDFSSIYIAVKLWEANKMLFVEADDLSSAYYLKKNKIKREDDLIKIK
jgi:hypothetical protein